MPLAFLNPCGSKCIEDNSDRMFGFSRFSENSETLFEVSTNRKVCRPSKSRFAKTNVANSGQSKGAQACAIHVECEKVPKIFDTTEMVWLNVPLLVTDSSGFLVVEAHFDLLEHGVAELFEEMNIRNRSPCASERYG